MPEDKPSFDFAQLGGEVEELMADMMDVLKALTSDGTVETCKYRVTLDVPVPIAKFLEKMAVRTGVELDDILSKMASDGLDKSLRGAVGGNRSAPESQPKPNVDLTDQLKAAGIDFSGLTEGLGKLGNLADQLQQMQAAVENATAATSPTGHDSTPEDKEDPE